MEESEAVRWVQNVPVSDVNWRSNLERLTDEELRYCLEVVTQRSKRPKLEAYARRRGVLSRKGA